MDELMKKLQGMGAEGQRLANTALNVIGKGDEAANKAWMATSSNSTRTLVCLGLLRRACAD
jgi:hypothetical protein